MTQKPRVMIIEDDPDMIELLSLILRRGGYEPIPALGGKEGLRLLPETKADLILLDLRMPVMDGFEMTRRLKEDERTSHIPIILLTAKKLELDTEQISRELQIDLILGKPFSPKEMVRVASRLLTEAAQSAPV